MIGNENTNHIDLLDNDALAKIFDWLDYKSICSILLTCKRFYEEGSFSSRHKNILLREHGEFLKRRYMKELLEFTPKEIDHELQPEHEIDGKTEADTEEEKEKFDEVKFQKHMDQLFQKKPLMAISMIIKKENLEQQHNRQIEQLKQAHFLPENVSHPNSQDMAGASFENVESLGAFLTAGVIIIAVVVVAVVVAIFFAIDYFTNDDATQTNSETNTVTNSEPITSDPNFDFTLPAYWGAFALALCACILVFCGGLARHYYHNATINRFNTLEEALNKPLLTNGIFGGYGTDQEDQNSEPDSTSMMNPDKEKVPEVEEEKERSIGFHA